MVPGVDTAGARQQISDGAGRLAADELLVEQRLAVGAADGDHLVALAEDRLRTERRGDAVAHDREQRAALRDRQVGRASCRERVSSVV